MLYIFKRKSKLHLWATYSYLRLGSLCFHFRKSNIALCCTWIDLSSQYLQLFLLHHDSLSATVVYTVQCSSMLAPCSALVISYSTQSPAGACPSQARSPHTCFPPVLASSKARALGGRGNTYLRLAITTSIFAVTRRSPLKALLYRLVHEPDQEASSSS